MRTENLCWKKLCFVTLLCLGIACRSQAPVTENPAVQTTEVQASKNKQTQTPAQPAKSGEVATPSGKATTPIPPADATLTKTDGSLRILHFSSWEAAILPFFEEGNKIGGMGHLAATIEQRRNAKTVLLTMGDFLPGDSGDQRPAIEGLNLLKLAVSSLENLELNYGTQKLQKQLKDACFRVISANVYQDDKRLFPAYVIQDVEGIRVGFLGITSEEAAVKANPKSIQGLRFNNPLVELKPLVEELKGKTDLLILLSSLRYEEDLQLAQQLPGLHIIIGRYDINSTHRTVQVGSTLIVRVSRKRGAELGEVDVQRNGNQWSFSAPRYYTIGPDSDDCRDLTPSAEVANFIHNWQIHEKELSSVIGDTEVLLEGDYQKVRQQETNFGNLLADIMLLNCPQADVALLNSGCLRASIAPGPITKGELLAALPHKNYVVELSVTGEAVKEILENGVAQYQKISGAFLQVAGISFTFSPDLPAFSRVTDIKIQSEPLQPKKVYRLATLDYLASGGDDYVMLRDKEQLSLSKTNFTEMVEAYLKQAKTIKPGVDGRIRMGNF